MKHKIKKMAQKERLTPRHEAERLSVRLEPWETFFKGSMENIKAFWAETRPRSKDNLRLKISNSLEQRKRSMDAILADHLRLESSFPPKRFRIKWNELKIERLRLQILETLFLEGRSAIGKKLAKYYRQEIKNLQKQIEKS